MSFKIPHIVVKCSRSLFLFYYITFASQGISLCFTIVKIEKNIRDYFEQVFLFVFQVSKITSLNIISFLGSGPENSISQNIRNFLRVSSFYFLSSESYFLKYKKNIKLAGSISRKIRKFQYAKGSEYSFPKIYESFIIPGFRIYLS